MMRFSSYRADLCAGRSGYDEVLREKGSSARRTWSSTG